MPKERLYDSGLMAPKTGRVLPVNKDKTKWNVDCYLCGAVSQAKTRREAIEQHVGHYEDEHD